MTAAITFDHIGLVVDDLETVAAFFTGLGFTRDDLGESSGDWVDRIVGLPGTVEDLVLISAPDGSGHIELTKFRSPASLGTPVDLPSNAYGLRHIAFRVRDVKATAALAKELGYDLVGEVVDFRNLFRLAYVRGPEGLILELTEDLNALPEA
ncbi:MAG: VOC family protein [Microbacteriaceae bacterium]|nr:VOC family protein [Microbacteriaceae bacterium]MCL2795273.1 VOC family protein [Microbacteriaceae bacterium]